ncbi:DsbE family thiol:disulfide interchange protein [Bowmanella dokdonensis]|uniref:DsbE family thiol:disulfide interchange protein n=1 Tax=Bowmanella dokdonensis TaxID=751969 RepID=A0A939ING4_9ALTE|nr:DsbE family thiol:disulfide interchange protein [Bowmanella dokdonensis]MBN7826333.1 DsbE family thiol:disulfide interchange protein [Bowmanella dokdonensis]
MKRIALFLLPLALFLFISLFLLQGLFSDPRERESSLLNRPVPAFSLPDVMDETRIYTPEVFEGEVTLLNVWGTWCVTCAIELPFLTELKEQGVRIVGLYYEQNLDPDFGGKSIGQIRADIRQKLDQLGNPYAFNIFDHSRDTSLDLGVTGAPETFLIDSQGRIRLHHVGDLNPRVWESRFAPLYQELTQ